VATFEEAEVGGVIVFAGSSPMLQKYWLKLLAMSYGLFNLFPVSSTLLSI